MTDQQAALAALINSRAPFKAEMLVRFARAWANEPLLMNKWFQLQATAVAQPGEPAVLERVRLLLKHRAYSNANPNNVYALVLAFAITTRASSIARTAAAMRSGSSRSRRSTASTRTSPPASRARSTAGAASRPIASARCRMRCWRSRAARPCRATCARSSPRRCAGLTDAESAPSTQTRPNIDDRAKSHETRRASSRICSTHYLIRANASTASIPICAC